MSKLNAYTISACTHSLLSESRRRCQLFFVNDIYNPNHFLKDQQRIKMIRFHVEKDDYFGHLATILNLMVQDKSIRTEAMLNKYAEDLKYMQKNFTIAPREDADLDDGIV